MRVLPGPETERDNLGAIGNNISVQLMFLFAKSAHAMPAIFSTSLWTAHLTSQTQISLGTRRRKVNKIYLLSLLRDERRLLRNVFIRYCFGITGKRPKGVRFKFISDCCVSLLRCSAGEPVAAVSHIGVRTRKVEWKHS